VEVVRFQEMVSGKEQYEVCRLFLASLQLVREGGREGGREGEREVCRLFLASLQLVRREGGREGGRKGRSVLFVI